MALVTQRRVGGHRKPQSTYWSRSRTTSGGELAVGAVRQGRRGKDGANGDDVSSGSSSPTATTLPPLDRGGTLGDATEADGGRGFLRTGEGVLTVGVWVWNAEKDWTGTLAGIDGFKRGEGSRGSEVGRWGFILRGRSIWPS